MNLLSELSLRRLIVLTTEGEGEKNYGEENKIGFVTSSSYEDLSLVEF